MEEGNVKEFLELYLFGSYPGPSRAYRAEVLDAYADLVRYHGSHWFECYPLVEMHKFFVIYQRNGEGFEAVLDYLAAIAQKKAQEKEKAEARAAKKLIKDITAGTHDSLAYAHYKKIVLDIESFIYTPSIFYNFLPKHGVTSSTLQRTVEAALLRRGNALHEQVLKAKQTQAEQQKWLEAEKDKKAAQKGAENRKRMTEKRNWWKEA